MAGEAGDGRKELENLAGCLALLLPEKGSAYLSPSSNASKGLARKEKCGETP